MSRYKTIDDLFPYKVRDWYQAMGYQYYKNGKAWVTRAIEAGHLKENEHYIYVNEDYWLTKEALVFWKLRICPQSAMEVANGKMPNLGLPSVDPLEEYKIRRNITPRLAARIAGYIRVIQSAIAWMNSVDDNVMVSAGEVKRTLRSFKLLIGLFVNLDDLQSQVDEMYKPDPGRKEYFKRRYQAKKMERELKDAV